MIKTLFQNRVNNLKDSTSASEETNSSQLSATHYDPDGKRRSGRLRKNLVKETSSKV